MEKRYAPKITQTLNKERDNLVYGVHPVLETILAGKEIEKALVQHGLRSQPLSEIIYELKKRNFPYQFVPEDKLISLCGKTHQGIACFVAPIKYADLETIITKVKEAGRDPFVIVLDRVTDVRNFGAVARSAECAGVDAIIIPNKGSAQINSDALKTSAGALNYIPVCREENLKETLAYLRESGLSIVAVTEKANKELYYVPLDGPLAIILGSEEEGISGEYLRLCDHTLKIPMAGKVDSLNVSVAAALVMYESVRQKMIASK